MSIQQFFIGLSLFIPITANALLVEIQGVALKAPLEGSSCINIEGDYKGFSIEASEAGKIARICYNSVKINSIAILNSVFIAKAPLQKDISIFVEHLFPPGINGKIMARARLQGFFSTSEGISVPSGDQVSFSAFFSQANHDDAIMPSFEMQVGDSIDSALFDFSAKKNYLIAGSRTLKAKLNLNFNAEGQKLNLLEKNIVAIDTGSTFEDKLENFEEGLPIDLNTNTLR